MSTNKMVMVPQDKLDAIETARRALYELFAKECEGDIKLQMALTNITEPMWLIANTKWKAVDK